MNDKKRKSRTEYLFEHGRLPPQVIDLEEAVLGAVMLEKGAIEKVISFLKPETFYKEANQKLFKAVIKLHEKGEPIDILTVTLTLKNSGDLDIVGGPYYITTLTNRIASAANVEYHARKVAQKFIARELIRISSETIREAYEDTTDIFDLMEQAEAKLNEVLNIEKGEMDISAKSRMDATIKFIVDGMNNAGITGVPIGINSIDTFTGGFQNADLIVIGGLPGTYKTALAIAFAHGAEKLGHPSYLSEQEMSKVQTGMREIGMISGINTEQMRRGELSHPELNEIHDAKELIIKKKVYVEHESGITVDKLTAKLKRVVLELGVKIAFIDYLQIMEESAETKNYSIEEKVSKITRRLKQTAKALNIPIILLSQFNREASKNVRPTKSQLKGSGAIESDADVVILLWNPYVYDKDMTVEIEGSQESVKDKLCVIFDKHRMGRTGDIWLGVKPWNNTFYDLIKPSTIKPNTDFEPAKNETDDKPF